MYAYIDASRAHAHPTSSAGNGLFRTEVMHMAGWVFNSEKSTYIARLYYLLLWPIFLLLAEAKTGWSLHGYTTDDAEGIREAKDCPRNINLKYSGS
jgi:hypothetical protein